METATIRSVVKSIATVLLAWLALGPVLASSLSFIGALPTQFPTLVHFSATPLPWRVAFFAAGCLALLAAWSMHAGRKRIALAAAMLFAAMYLAIYPVVWAQRSVAMLAAVVAVVLVGALPFDGRRVAE